jgi:hypothetical protein
MKMNWKLFLALFIFLVSGILIYGSYLPEERYLTKIYHFKSSKQKVWESVRNIENQTSWRSDLKEVTILSKDPETWKEKTSSGSEMTFATVELLENSVWKMKIIEPTYLEGNWVGTFQDLEDGTEIRFRESVRVKNPFFRILSFLFFDIDKTMNLYIHNLSLHLGETFEEKNLRTSVE